MNNKQQYHKDLRLQRHHDGTAFPLSFFPICATLYDQFGDFSRFAKVFSHPALYMYTQGWVSQWSDGLVSYRGAKGDLREVEFLLALSACDIPEQLSESRGHEAVQDGVNSRAQVEEHT